MIKAIVFDCFGVIIADVLENLKNTSGLTDEDKDKITQSVIAANKGDVTREANRLKIAAILGLSVEEYAAKLKNNEVKNMPLLNYIRALRPQFKTGLLTNIGSNKSLHSRFPESELAIYFDEVVASGEVGYAKPDAEAYGIIANRLGVKLDECIMVDDREEYCQGAINAGMAAILHRSNGTTIQEIDKLIGRIN
ncbi:MAG: HAD-IA family hydrolase [Candidatus Saccharimonas sp.]